MIMPNFKDEPPPDINEEIQIGRGTIVSMMGPIVHWTVAGVRGKLKRLYNSNSQAESHISYRGLDKELVGLGVYMRNLENDLEIAQEAYSRCRQVCLRQKARIEHHG